MCITTGLDIIISKLSMLLKNELNQIFVWVYKHKSTFLWNCKYVNVFVFIWFKMILFSFCGLRGLKNKMKYQWGWWCARHDKFSKFYAKKRRRTVKMERYVITIYVMWWERWFHRAILRRFRWWSWLLPKWGRSFRCRNGNSGRVSPV